MSEQMSDAPETMLLVHTNDPLVETMGGGVAYMNFLLSEAISRGIETKYLGVEFRSRRDPVALAEGGRSPTLIPVLRNDDGWLKFFLTLLIKAVFIKTTPKTVIHVQRLVYLFPFCLLRKKGIFVLTSDMPLITAIEKYGPLFKALYPIFKAIELTVLNRIDGVISDHRVLDSYYHAKYPKFSAKFYKSVDPAVGLDLSKFKVNVTSHTRRILFVGRIDEVKRVDFLLAAFASFLDGQSELGYKLVVVGGDGGHLSVVEEALRDLGLQNHVELKGPLFGEDLRHEYEQAALFTLASRSEGNPTVVREAISSGVPVVSTDVGDVSRLLTNSSLREIVAVDASPQEYADAIASQLAKTPSEQDFLDAREKYSASSIFDELLTFYGTLYDQRYHV